jgi:tetratricopeptide (TPR) repeat protein
VDVATGKQLWTSTYDRETAKLLDLQDEIAGAIMDDGLRVRLTTAERTRLVRHPTSDGEAYDLYLQARHHQRGATEEGYRYSIELLDKAIVRDPNFALAYASISGNYAMLVTDGLMRPTDALAAGQQVHEPGIASGSRSGTQRVRARTGVSVRLGLGRGGSRAQAFFADSGRRVRSSSVASHGREHWAMGRQAEALQMAKRTRELDPRSPYLAVLEADYLLQYGQYDAAIALYEYATRLDPQNPNGFFGLAEARARQGRFDEAIEARRHAHAVAGDDALATVLATAKASRAIAPSNGPGCRCSSGN